MQTLITCPNRSGSWVWLEATPFCYMEELPLTGAKRLIFSLVRLVKAGKPWEGQLQLIGGPHGSVKTCFSPSFSEFDLVDFRKFSQLRSTWERGGDWLVALSTSGAIRENGFSLTAKADKLSVLLEALRKK